MAEIPSWDLHEEQAVSEVQREHNGGHFTHNSDSFLKKYPFSQSQVAPLIALIPVPVLHAEQLLLYAFVQAKHSGWQAAHKETASL